MGDRKFTFIELHLDGDHQFGPRTIGDALPIGETATDEATDEAEEDEAAAAPDEEGGRGKAVGAILALALLVAAGVAVRKYRGGEEDEADREEQPDVIVT